MREQSGDRPGIGPRTWRASRLAPLASALGVIVAATAGLVLGQFGTTPADRPLPAVTSVTVDSTPVPHHGLAIQPKCPETQPTTAAGESC